MQLMQRLGCNTDEKYVNEYIDIILSNPGSSDNVWIPTMYGYPSLDFHKNTAEQWRGVAQKFREKGISVSMQLSNTIGHGQYMARRDCSGLVYEGSPAEKLVGHDGVVCEYSFCWRGENFRKYINESLSYYIEAVKPDRLWVDDDCRAFGHAPVFFGCFCDNCIAQFNKQYGSAFAREELVEEMLHGDIIWRERYISFVREGLYSFVYEIGQTVHKISPETALAHQHGAYGAFTGHGLGYIFDAMRDSTGKAPYSRPGGGAYDDHDPNAMLEKGQRISFQNSTLPEYVKHKCPEIESLPYVAFGKTPAGTAFETAYYFACGATDMTYSDKMQNNEPIEWYYKLFSLLSEQRPYYERMSQNNIDSYQAGIRYFVSEYAWKKEIIKGGNMWDLSEEPHIELASLLRNAIPVAYDKDEKSVFILHPENAKVMSNGEVEKLLGENVITDAETIKLLQERGFDFKLKLYNIEQDTVNMLSEDFTDHPVNPKNYKSFKSSFFTSGRKTALYIENNNPTAEILGIYASDTVKTPFTEDRELPFGIAELILTTSEGAKWAVLGYCPWKGVVPSFRRDHLLDIADYISGNALCARILDPVQAVLHPRKNSDGKVICISVTNCTIGESGEIKVQVRNPIGEKFTFMSQYGGTKTLDFEKQGENYIIKFPSLRAWSVGTIFIE